MRVLFSLFAIALICLGHAPTLADARVAIVASGGGIRATFGTILALDALKSKGIIDDINKFYGLSGGAWGVSWYQNRLGDTASIIHDVRAKEGGWGDMTEFHPVGCGEMDGWVYSSCHLGWVKSIKKDVFLNPQSIDITASFGSGQKRKDIAFLLDGCSEHKGKMVHTHQCSFEKSALNCVKMSDPTDFNTYDIASAEVRDSKDSYHRSSAYDWLGFTSSAWAEVGGQLGGYVTKTPADVKIKDTKGKQHHLKFCDSGAICNLPLGLFITRESEFLGGRIHRVILLDYSDDVQPMDSLIQCLDEHWRDRFGWTIQGKALCSFSFPYSPWSSLVSRGPLTVSSFLLSFFSIRQCYSFSLFLIS